MTKLKYIEKALLIGFVIAILFSFTSFTAFAAQCEQIPNEVFRLHVLANSDSEEDQALKLKVRDRLLDETGELFSECTTTGICCNISSMYFSCLLFSIVS